MDAFEYPTARPSGLESGQPWPCGRCGREADAVWPHQCIATVADLVEEEPDAA